LQNLGSAATYEASFDGQCIHFNATGNYSGSNVAVPSAAFADVEDEVTFSLWVKNDSNQPDWYQSIFGGANNFGGQSGLFGLMAPVYSGEYQWLINSSMATIFNAGSDDISYNAPGHDYYTDWNHYGLVKNIYNGEMWLYINGELIAYGKDNYSSMNSCDEFKLGSNHGDSGFWQGCVDDFRIYNRALSHAEILTLANVSTATVDFDMFKADKSDINSDEAVDFKDYSVLASEWLEESLWP